MLTSRSRELLKKIIDSQYPLRVKDLASEFRVSERTIKYDLDVVRLWLKEQKAYLNSQPNKGIWFSGDPVIRKELRSMLDESDKKNVFLNQQDRIESIMLDLLLTDHSLSLNDIAEKIGVSRNTIISDMQKVEILLHSLNLGLQRKTGTGIWLLGSEIQRRLASEYLLQARLGSREMFETVQAVMHKNILLCESKLSEKFLLLVTDLEIVFKSVKDLTLRAKEELGVFFEDRVIIGVLIRLCVVIVRIRSKHEIASDSLGINKYFSLDQSKLFNICEDVLAALSDKLDLDIPSHEVGYVSLQFMCGSLPLLYKEGVNSKEVPDPVSIARKMIKRVSEVMNNHFDEDAELLDNLLAHLTEKLAKYKYGVIDPNPIVSEIRRSYPDMFEGVKNVCLEILTQFDVFLTDSDIAYIVLHFQAAYERKTGISKLKTLVVCGTGRGTARLVRTLLENELKNLQVVGVYSITEVEKVMKTQNVDFVVSVLPIDLSIPVVVVNTIPTKHDLEAILEVTKSLRMHKPEPVLEPEYRNNVLDEFSVLRSKIDVKNLPLLESISRDVVIKGFEVSQIITTQFKEYLTEQGMAGLTLHLYLMVHRFVFSSPYEDNNPHDPLEPDYATGLRRRLEEILTQNQISIPHSEMNAILRYFHLPRTRGCEKKDDS